MSLKKEVTRRKIIAFSGAIIATSAMPRIALGVDKLSEDDPTAIALGYKHDANAVDTARFPKRAGVEGSKQLCSNCKLYVDQGDGWGTCSIFQGKLVAGPGWCNAWIKI